MKNIILCSDGTGNSGGKSRGTNVWRLFNAVEVQDRLRPQVRFYDDGVGTEGIDWLRKLGGATGLGLSRNIRQLYAYLVEQYEGADPEGRSDRIYLFGFSRGAFTVRALAGMVGVCGLLNREAYHALPSHRREKLLNRLLRHYRTAQAYRKPEDWFLRELHAEFSGDLGGVRISLSPCPIRFIGVWDTVDAVGMPIDEMREWMDTGWRRLTGRRLYGFHDQVLGGQVDHAVQALAIDDERKTFWPNVWHADDRVEQVWFSGAHSNIGGGYPKDAMAYVTLDWMMERAKARGLRFRRGARPLVQGEADVHGRLYDSRKGVGMFYRPRPRFDSKHGFWGEDPKSVHTSVFERLERGTDGYAPRLPEEFRVETTSGGPYRAEPDRLPSSDKGRLKRVEDCIRRRTGLYWGFVGFNLAVVLAALYDWWRPNGDIVQGMGAPMWVLEALLPGGAEGLAEVLGRHPVFSAFAAIGLVGLLWQSRKLRLDTRDALREAWSPQDATTEPASGSPRDEG